MTQRAPRRSADPARRYRLVTVFVLAAVVGGMTGLAFASVPLYRLFCQVTGFGGTPRIDTAATAGDTANASNRIVTVRFDANVDPGLPWRFRPVQRQVEVRLGDIRLAHFEAENRGTRSIIGAATFNVTPAKAAPYFVKVQCFCLDEQTLAAGQTGDMPVSFFVDPAIDEDPDARDVNTITLSYTFFRAEDDADPAAAAAKPAAVALGDG